MPDDTQYQSSAVFQNFKSLTVVRLSVEVEYVRSAKFLTILR
jgi:hypothetical protein